MSFHRLGTYQRNPATAQLGICILLAGLCLNPPQAYAANMKWWALGTFIQPLQDTGRQTEQEMQANAPAWAAFKNGKSATRTGDHKRAIASFKRAIELFGPKNPLTAKVYAKQAQFLRDAKRNQEAIQSLTALISLNPDRPEGYWSRARIHLDARDYSKALGDYEIVARLSPNLVGAHMNRGVALYNLRRSEQALGAFQNAIEAAGKRYAAILEYWSSIGYAKPAPGFVSMFLSLLRRDHDLTIAKAHVWLGKTHFRRSRFWAAKRAYEQAIKIAPEYEVSYKYRGWLNEKMGYIPEARADYKRAASLKLADPWVVKALRRVR